MEGGYAIDQRPGEAASLRGDGCLDVLQPALVILVQRDELLQSDCDKMIHTSYLRMKLEEGA